jgi:hypothetical protein
MPPRTTVSAWRPRRRRGDAVRKWRFYGLALMLPAVLVSLGIGIAVVTGWGDFTWDESVPLPLE